MDSLVLYVDESRNQLWVQAPGATNVFISKNINYCLLLNDFSTTKQSKIKSSNYYCGTRGCMNVCNG